MKISKILIAVLVTMSFQTVFGQSFNQPPIDNFRQPGLAGINQFEAPKKDTIPFDKIRVRIGADFAMQF
jgi:hypothetical protein